MLITAIEHVTTLRVYSRTKHLLTWFQSMSGADRVRFMCDLFLNPYSTLRLDSRTKLVVFFLLFVLFEQANKTTSHGFSRCPQTLRGSKTATHRSSRRVCHDITSCDYTFGCLRDTLDQMHACVTSPME